MNVRRRTVLLYSALILHHGIVSDTLGRASKNRMYSLPLSDLLRIKLGRPSPVWDLEKVLFEATGDPPQWQKVASIAKCPAN